MTVKRAVVATMVAALTLLGGANVASAAPRTASVGAPALRLAAGNHPELNGARLQQVGRPEVYLVLDGTRHWIPNPDTYNQLFRDWNGIQQVIDITNIDEGAAITDRAVLMRAPNTAPVYLVSNGVKRWVTSPQAMDKYYLDWNKIQAVPQVVVNSVPTGGNLG